MFWQATTVHECRHVQPYCCCRGWEVGTWHLQCVTCVCQFIFVESQQVVNADMLATPCLQMDAKTLDRLYKFDRCRVMKSQWLQLLPVVTRRRIWARRQAGRGSLRTCQALV